MHSANELEPDLADRLRKSLRVSGVSVGDMAAFLEVHTNTIGGWLHRGVKPNPANIRLWAQLTAVPYEWLRDGTAPEGQNMTPAQVRR